MKSVLSTKFTKHYGSSCGEQAGIEGLDEFLTGPIATSTEDVVAPPKVIAGFAKEHEALEIKTGVMEGSVISKRRS